MPESIASPCSRLSTCRPSSTSWSLATPSSCGWSTDHRRDPSSPSSSLWNQSHPRFNLVGDAFTEGFMAPLQPLLLQVKKPFCPAFLVLVNGRTVTGVVIPKRPRPCIETPSWKVLL
ncbi:hypothetical protein SEVIR_9G291350v4 [Setaria viridis]